METNTEVGRGWKNSSIDPRNKYELYLEPFRRCIEESGAEGIMTAYNRINGTVGGMVRENMEISESVIMKQADQKMYENQKKVHGESPQWIVPAGLFVVQ